MTFFETKNFAITGLALSLTFVITRAVYLNASNREARARHFQIGLIKMAMILYKELMKG